MTREKGNGKKRRRRRRRMVMGFEDIFVVCILGSYAVALR
jgi:hypothetical protein